MNNRWAVGCWLVAALGLGATAAAAGDAGGTATAPANVDELLSQERWSERSYGVSLRPPLGSRLIERTGDDAVLRIHGAGDYSIVVYIKKSTAEVTIDKVQKAAMEQVGLAQPSAVVMEQKEVRPAGRPGAILYFRIPQRADKKKQDQPWVLGQAFMQIDPHTLVMLQLDVDLPRMETARGIFEAVVDSLTVEDPKVLDEERKQAIAHGKAWLAALKPQQLQAAMAPEQWLRILENGKDVGYMRIRQAHKKVMDFEGIEVDVQARIVTGEQAIDTLSNFFVSDDDVKEIWSIKMTIRPVNPKPAAKKPTQSGGAKVSEEVSWAETGLRSGEDITVSRQSPSGVRKFEWKKPPTAYLSQAVLYLMGPLLAQSDAQQLGFYAYFPNTGKMSLRLEQIERKADGSLVVRTRPSLEQPEQITQYDSQGKLVHRQLPGGQMVEPTTPEQMKAIWKLR